MALLAVVLIVFYNDFKFFFAVFPLAPYKNAPAYGLFSVCNGHFITAMGALYLFHGIIFLLFLGKIKKPVVKTGFYVFHIVSTHIAK